LVAVSTRAKPSRVEPMAAGGRSSPPGTSIALSALRARLPEMDAAVYTEGIDPSGPLGVWCRVQKDIVAALAAVAEEQSSGMVERLASFQQAMQAAIVLVEAEIALLKAGTEAARQVMLSVKAETTNAKEERLKAGDDMAIRLSDKIQECLESTMLVRERRWNLRQNVTLAALGAGLLFGAFVGGQWVQGHSMGQAIIDRCRTHLAVDPATKVAYCAMNTVEGHPETAPQNR